MEAAEAAHIKEEGSEPGGYLYETLDPLSFFDPDTPQAYSVYRNEITSSPGPPSAPAAVDYFSLEVEGENANDESKDEKPSTPRGSNDGGRKQASESAWFRSGSRFKSPMLQLHQEILDFTKFISPTPDEQASRSAAVERVFEVIKYIWPDCNVEVFGSFRTGLYLPTSDIDAVILDSKVKTPQIGLRALSRALSQRNIAKKIQVIAKARVPIIKFVESQSGVAFDVSFDVENGPKAADYIKDAVSRIPPLRPLCLLLKVFLQQRELNEVFSGGIGSYALLAMLIAQLQVYWKNQQLSSSKMPMEHNLGILLVDFFSLYGRKINVWDVGISCNLTDTFFLKSRRGFLNDERPYLLSIEDPQAPDNDIGRNSYNYFKVRSAFSMAYSSLTDAKAIISLGPNRSILGTIIRADPMLLERKGVCGGELNLDNLLSSAVEPMSEQFSDGHALYNWRLVDEDPFPRGEVVHEHASSSKKKKGLKLKYRSDENTHGNTSDQQTSSDEYRRKETKEKKRRKQLKGFSYTNGF